MTPLIVVVWVVGGFLAGSLPFSVWLGYWMLSTEIRGYGDGNPGAANAWRAGKWRVGLPALLLDFLKGAVPVSLARLPTGYSGWALLPLSLAPVLGHAFSPFLRFRGGKAVATTFGVWAGLTLWEGPTVLGLFCGLFWMLQIADAWVAVLSMGALLGYWLVRGANAVILWVCVSNLLVLAWTHRRDLGRAPRWRLRCRLRPRRPS
jgi:glycerol-3-phosphate acyltransferase PlsY